MCVCVCTFKKSVNSTIAPEFSEEEFHNRPRKQAKERQGNDAECTAHCCFKGTGEFKATTLTSTHRQNHSRQ